MIEIILGSGTESVDIQNPPLVGNSQAKLRLFVSLAVQRNKSQILSIHKLQQRSRSGLQRRRLIKMPIEGAKHPVYFWHSSSGSKTRACGIFYNVPRKMGLAHTRTQSEP